MNTALSFLTLNPGGLFYMDHCPGNTYRKVDNKTAEFAQHRLGNQFVGCRITMGNDYVRKEPFNDLLDEPLPPPAFIGKRAPKGFKMAGFVFEKREQVEGRIKRDHKPCMVCDAPAPFARGICYACQPQTEEELLA